MLKSVKIKPARSIPIIIAIVAPFLILLISTTCLIYYLSHGLDVNNSLVLLLHGIAILASCILSFFTAQHLTKTITTLNHSMRELAEGKWKNNISESGPFSEVNTLIRSYNNMVHQRLHSKSGHLRRRSSDRKERDKDLRESKGRLVAILQAIPDPLVVYDSNGFPLYMNPSFTKVFGWTKDEFAGRRIPFVPKEEEKITREKIKEIYKTGRPTQFETTRLNKDNRKVNVQLSAAIVKDLTDSHTGLVVILKNISERMAMEEELRHAHKMESIGTLTSGIAHDFNNILSIIVGNSELALENIPDWHTAHLNLKEIKNAGLKASAIVKQLQSFSRKTDHNLVPIQIGPIIYDTLKLLRSTIPSTIEIRKNISAADKTVLADPIQINQIIMNLCINSYHEMEESGGIIEITVDDMDTPIDPNNANNNSTDENYVRLSISDNGNGIDPAIVDRIFDPYFTTKDIGKGSGMGLAVVHGIVQNHGGTINVENRPGQGVTFTILLPTIEASPAIATTDKTNLRLGDETILIVDDEQAIVTMTQNMVEQLGYCSEGTTCPEKALSLFQEDPDAFDLVISDMTMPKMTGIALSEKIKAINPKIPVIICTGHAPVLNSQKTDDCDVAAYITKPTPMHELAETLRQVLDRKKHNPPALGSSPH